MSLPPSRLQQQLPPSQQQVAPQAQVEQPATVNTHLPHPHWHAEMIKGAFHPDLCLVVAGVSSAFSSSDELSVQTKVSWVFSPHKVKFNVHQHNNDQFVLIIQKVWNEEKYWLLRQNWDFRRWKPFLMQFSLNESFIKRHNTTLTVLWTVRKYETDLKTFRLFSHLTSWSSFLGFLLRNEWTTFISRTGLWWCHPVPGVLLQSES